MAPRGGVVEIVGYQAGGAGHYVVLDGDGEDYDYVFMHLRSGSIPRRAGERVRTGQPIGEVGSTGRSSGPHLHFEIWVGGWFAGGKPIDPLPLLQWLEDVRTRRSVQRQAEACPVMPSVLDATEPRQLVERPREHRHQRPGIPNCGATCSRTWRAMPSASALTTSEPSAPSTGSARPRRARGRGRRRSRATNTSLTTPNKKRAAVREAGP